MQKVKLLLIYLVHWFKVGYFFGTPQNEMRKSSFGTFGMYQKKSYSGFDLKPVHMLLKSCSPFFRFVQKFSYPNHVFSFLVRNSHFYLHIVCSLQPGWNIILVLACSIWACLICWLSSCLELSSLLVVFLNVMSILDMVNRLYQQLSTGWTYRWQNILERVTGPKFMLELSIFMLILILLNKVLGWMLPAGIFWWRYQCWSSMIERDCCCHHTRSVEYGIGSFFFPGGKGLLSEVSRCCVSFPFHSQINTGNFLCFFG